MNPMMPYGGHAFQVLGFLVWGALMLVVLAIAVVVVILLVRFLWFGTKAAKLYLASHEPSVAAPTAEPVPDATTPVTPDASGPLPDDATTAVITQPPAAPATPPKTRKPKA